MPKKSQATSKKAPIAKQKAAAATQPAAGKVTKKKERVPKSKNPLFQRRPRNFGIGNDLQPPRDLTRFVRWPKYIRLQRQRRVLLKRLKVPGVINQFNKTLDKHSAAALFNFLEKYKPETRQQKKKRLLKLVAKGAAADAPTAKKPKYIKAGIKHVTHLVEQKEAKLVIIAHDVDPIEIVLWLPTLCRKKGVPYLIVKGKARLGKLVHKKTASCLAVTDIDQNRDGNNLSIFVEKANDNFNNRLTDQMKTPGGGIMGSKHHDRKKKEEKRRVTEQNKKKQ